MSSHEGDASAVSYINSNVVIIISSEDHTRRASAARGVKCVFLYKHTAGGCGPFPYNNNFYDDIMLLLLLYYIIIIIVSH